MKKPLPRGLNSLSSLPSNGNLIVTRWILVPFRSQFAAGNVPHSMSQLQIRYGGRIRAESATLKSPYCNLGQCRPASDQQCVDREPLYLMTQSGLRCARIFLSWGFIGSVPLHVASEAYSPLLHGFKANPAYEQLVDHVFSNGAFRVSVSL